MSYKRKYFIEHLDEILRESNTIFILDRGGCIMDLNLDGNQYTASQRVYLFRKCPEEWKLWFEHRSPSDPIEEILDETIGERCDASFEDTIIIQNAIIQLLANRKDLRDIIITVDGHYVID